MKIKITVERCTGIVDIPDEDLDYLTEDEIQSYLDEITSDWVIDNAPGYWERYPSKR